MTTTALDEKKIEELVEKTVQKHFKLTFEDMEEVRRSPGGAIIRVEGRLDAIERRLDGDMVTRVEFANFRAELKDDLWKFKLYIILWAALMLLTTPKVIELFGN
jgi:hypothetical protein